MRAIRIWIIPLAGIAWALIFTQGCDINIDTEIRRPGTVPGAMVTDIEGNTYHTVIIGEQEWMAENLRTTKLNDNTEVPLITDKVRWLELKTPGYCWYNNDYDAYGSAFGALYNWYTVNTGKLCPTGWRVPADEDWRELAIYLHANGLNYDGSTSGTWESNNNYGKSLAATTYWVFRNISGAVGNDDYPDKSNITGFSALPGGGRDNGATFYGINEAGIWWTLTEYSSSSAYYRTLNYYSTSLGRSGADKLSGHSVRCIRNKD